MKYMMAMIAVPDDCELKTDTVRVLIKDSLTGVMIGKKTKFRPLPATAPPKGIDDVYAVGRNDYRKELIAEGRI